MTSSVLVYETDKLARFILRQLHDVDWFQGQKEDLLKAMDTGCDLLLVLKSLAETNIAMSENPREVGFYTWLREELTKPYGIEKQGSTRAANDEHQRNGLKSYAGQHDKYKSPYLVQIQGRWALPIQAIPAFTHNEIYIDAIPRWLGRLGGFCLFPMIEAFHIENNELVTIPKSFWEAMAYKMQMLEKKLNAIEVAPGVDYEKWEFETIYKTPSIYVDLEDLGFVWGETFGSKSWRDYQIDFLPPELANKVKEAPEVLCYRPLLVDEIKSLILTKNQVANDVLDSQNTGRDVEPIKEALSDIQTASQGLADWKMKIQAQAALLWSSYLNAGATPKKHRIATELAIWCQREKIVTDNRKVPSAEYLARHVLREWIPPKK